MDRNCRTAFGEKSFVTIVVPGNGHRTAVPRTAFRAFLTVVAALFRASTAMPSLPCAAFRAFATVIPRTWTSTAMPRAGIRLAFGRHLAFVTVVTTLFQEIDTHCHATSYISGSVAITVIPRMGIINSNALNSRELVCDQGLTVVPLTAFGPNQTN